jgi:hypothetical protein
MELNFVTAATADFDPQLYVRLLVTVAKADPENGPPEIDYVRRQAQRLGIDFDAVWAATDRDFRIDQVRASRLTALLVIKDCINLATLDGSFSLGEKERVYTYAEKLDIPRRDVDAVERWIEAYNDLAARWERIVREN